MTSAYIHNVFDLVASGGGNVPCLSINLSSLTLLLGINFLGLLIGILTVIR